MRKEFCCLVGNEIFAFSFALQYRKYAYRWIQLTAYMVNLSVSLSVDHLMLVNNCHSECSSQFTNQDFSEASEKRASQSSE